jgi:hypothetical protein
MSIYIASHKPYTCPASPQYRILAVGGVDVPARAVSDDTGDNIVAKNLYYDELTGTYWLWKNCTDPYVGLCHYRRYLNFIPWANRDPLVVVKQAPEVTNLLENPVQEEIMHRLLDTYDLIVSRAIFFDETIAQAYRREHQGVGWDAFIRRLDQMYGRDRHLMGSENKLHIGNMLIAKKPMFDLYAEELFGVLDPVFEEIGIPDGVEGARYQPYRYPAYLAERFMAAFLRVHKLNYYEAQLFTILE